MPTKNWNYNKYDSFTTTTKYVTNYKYASSSLDE